MVNFRIKVLPDGSTMIFGDILIFYKKITVLSHSAILTKCPLLTYTLYTGLQHMVYQHTTAWVAKLASIFVFRESHSFKKQIRKFICKFSITDTVHTLNTAPGHIHHGQVLSTTD